ncbi:MAG: hypothetical protein AB9922_10970 [Bacteroidales bacterium]
MLKKVSIIVSSLVFVLAIFIFLRSSLTRNKNNIDQSKEMIQYIVSTAEHNQKEILYNPLLNQPCYFGKDSTKPVMLKEICDTNKIFFYFSEKLCSPCIDNTIKVLKDCFPDYKNDSSIIFISPDFPKRLSEDCYGKRLLTLKTGKLGLPMKEQYPLFFRLNENMEVVSAHIVVKVDFKRTLNYLRRQKMSRKRT